MPTPHQGPAPDKGQASRSLMVRLDDEGKTYLVRSAKLRGISPSDYARAVTIPQARREVQAAREQGLAMTPEEQLAFWNALAESPTLTEPRRRPGRS